MTEIILKILLSYLLGSLMGGLILGKLTGAGGYPSLLAAKVPAQRMPCGPMARLLPRESFSSIS